MPQNLLHKNPFNSWVLLLFASNSVISCTGEFAQKTIYENEQTARMYGVVGIIIFLTTVILYFLRRNKGLAIVIISFAVLVFHPGWSRGAFAGDCGFSVVEFAEYFTTFLTLGLVIQLILYFRGWSQK
jgi:hypothetical protein